MPYHWSGDTKFDQLTLEVEDKSCPECGRTATVCDHRHRRIHNLSGPLRMTIKLTHCPEESCPKHSKTVSAEEELGIAIPYWAIGWDIFTWIGHRRFSRHWSVSQIRNELMDTYGIRLADDAIENYIKRYEAMPAAHQQDPGQLKEAYEGEACNFNDRSLRLLCVPLRELEQEAC